MTNPSCAIWKSILAMILGIVMLSAIGYVTMSTGERPFQAINKHVNPVLGWTWALACLAANMVWCLPQFSLANSVFEQNLWPGLYADAGLGKFWAKVAIAGGILLAIYLLAICLRTQRSPWAVVGALQGPIGLAFATDNPLVALYSAVDRLDSQLGADRELAETIVPFGVLANQHGQILLLMEEFHEQSIEAPEDVPVEIPQIVPRDIIPVVGELGRKAAPLRTSLPPNFPHDRRPRH